MTEAQTGVMTPDETLVDLARGGDLPAREELFRRHERIAYSVACRLLGHEQDARDAVQDGFLKAVLHLKEFDGRSGFRTWLLKVVHNAALDLGRKRRRRHTLQLSENESERSMATEFDPASGMRRDDLRRLLDAGLSQLNPPIRSTFVLFAEAELSYKEVAECLGVPVGTVMSRIHYARQKLQTYLEGIQGL